MSYVFGTHIPDHHSPQTEICHSFVYRWLIASGVFTGNYPDPLVEYNGIQAKSLLWQFTGNPARINDVIQVRPGDIVGFWDGPWLMHSMIAITSTSWIGSNNGGCFSDNRIGRIEIQNINSLLFDGNVRNYGWIGSENQWHSVNGATLTVTHMQPIRRHF
jgi:hypothetical protein